MGFPTRKALMRGVFGRGALIGVMLGGGLLYAGISQAQDVGVQGERDAELVAATGGPAPSTHLIAYEADKAAVEVRDDDVAALQPPADAKAAAIPAATPDPTSPPNSMATAQAAPAHR